MPGYIGYDSEYDLGGINHVQDSRNAIVRNDLALYLDAANINSYSGTGTVWSNLAEANTATFTANPSYTNQQKQSFFSFSPSGYYATLSSTNLASSNFSVSLWAKIKTPYEGGLRPRLFSVAETNFNLQFGYNELARNNEIFLRFNSVFSASLGTRIGEWANYCVTRSDSSVVIYVNGVSQNLITTNVPTANASLSGIGNYTNTQLVTTNSDISAILYYKKFLSQEEVLQNFNVLRGRYGI
jgi:hypothetical protein